MSKLPEPENSRITVIDGWRGLSVLFVIVGHLATRRYGSYFDAGVSNIARVFAGWGVGFFFVISGFIITKLALREERRGGFSVRDFYIRRFFRIIPPYFIYLIAVAICTELGQFAGTLDSVAVAATFTCNFPNSYCEGWFIGHTWTLAYEEQFYILFPLVVLVGGRRFGPILTALFVALTVYPFARYGLGLQGNWFVAEGFAQQFSFICIGCVAGTYDAGLSKIVKGIPGTLVTFGVGATLCALLWLQYSFVFPLGSRAAHLQVAVGDLMLPFCFCWLIVFTIHRNTWLTVVLNTKVFQFVGIISYSLYLWQQMFVASPASYLKPDSFLLFAPLMFVAAILSYYVIERPAIRYGKRVLAVLQRANDPIEPGVSELLKNSEV